MAVRPEGRSSRWSLARPELMEVLDAADLEDVHVHGTERIVDAVAKYDIDRFVHVSSHSARLDSPSEFYRTKAQGEQVARSIYPETTIVRPAPMFGFEDRLLHRLASPSNIITSNNLEERILSEQFEA